MLENIIGALGSCTETISLLILAISMGFSALPTAPAFLVAAIGMAVFNQVVPLSIMSEQLVLLNELTKDRRERQTMIFLAGLITAALGVCGVIGMIRSFVGQTILSAMMAGVGVLLAKVSLDMIRRDLLPGMVSLVTAIITYTLTSNLIYTVASCVVLTTLFFNIFRRKQIKETAAIHRAPEKIVFHKPVINKNVVRGTLAMLALILGEIFADASVSCAIAGWEYHGDLLAIYTGLANMVSGLLGGIPLGTIIGGSCAAPNPVFCGILMMLIITAILLLKLIPVISPYIPSQGVAGFIFVLAVFVVFPENALAAVSDMPLVSAVTIMVTAFVDPFLGMCSGVLLSYLIL